MARAWIARAFNVRAVAAASRRFDRSVAQRFSYAAQQCGRIDVSRPRRLAHRTFARSMRGPTNVRAWS
eukprot:6027966-Lingulodinium_polyedra.AAC.1